MDPKSPIFYSFFARLVGDSEQWTTDSLNPHGFLMPPEAESAIPVNMQRARSQWR